MSTDNTLGNGIAQLNDRRQRRTRQPLPSRHPVTTAAAPPPEQLDQTDTTPAAALSPAAAPSPTAAPTPTQPESPAPRSAPPAPTPPTSAPSVGVARGNRSGGLPPLEVDLTDPAAHIVSPTQLSIPASIVARFDKARVDAGSHTALVIDALRAHAAELPALILRRRPMPKEGDLFPFRAAASAAANETPMPLRIRPTRGELDVMKKLVEWANTRIAQQRPGAKSTNRSEMVAAALDAHLSNA